MADVNMSDIAKESSVPENSNTAVIYDEQRREELIGRLSKENEKLKHLPKGSNYATHRLRVVQRALKILTNVQNKRTKDDANELSRLLESLSL